MDVGVEINQYKVVEHIGRGGMADVWSARDQRLNRMVAIKTIAQSLSGEDDPVGMFKTEAQTIAQMEHPHILPIYDFGDFEGQLYIVMRYVAGGAVSDLLRRGAIPLNDTLRLGQAVAQALDYAHSRKVIHLDLKPANVLLDSAHSPYLADFGLATALDPEGKAQNPGSGTLLYMAPEQLTAEMIDHRADIYSFSILMFHMLTGQLPFDGLIPLALKQIQMHEELPDVDERNPNLPGFFSDVLRRGTAVNPEHRPSSLMELVDELKQALESASSGFAVGDGFEDFEEDFMSTIPEGLDVGGNMEILEAVDIYSRARHNWAGGNGSFLLGVTHFMLMNGYYMQAEEYGLEIDEPGLQMLLRGALEYNHEVDFWWSKLNDANRRWVCLHALRSGNAPARSRAMYRLETLPDSETSQIPRLVAQALQIETDEEARIAALQVLSTRAKLIKPTVKYDVKTEYRGRLLSTMTRLGVQVRTPTYWQEVVYNREIDQLIAEVALDNGMPRVAEFSARTVGRIRSEIAVAYISEAQKEGRKGALRALAFVRDEAPTLPPVVSREGRFYAWVTNSARRLFERPIHVVARYVTALLGAWLAMGYHVYSVYNPLGIFGQQRWANAIAIGLVFATIAGFVSIFAGEFSERTRGFWPWWGRLAFSLLTGVAFGAFAWWSYPWLLLNLKPSMQILIFGSFGFSLGYIITALFDLRSWVSVPLTSLLIFLPTYFTFQIGWMPKKSTWIQFYAGGDESLYPFPEINRLGLDLLWKDTVYRPYMIILALLGLGLALSIAILPKRKYFSIKRLNVKLPKPIVAPVLAIILFLLPMSLVHFLGWLEPSATKEIWPFTPLANIQINSEWVGSPYRTYALFLDIMGVAFGLLLFQWLGFKKWLAILAAFAIAIGLQWLAFYSNWLTPSEFVSPATNDFAKLTYDVYALNSSYQFIAIVLGLLGATFGVLMSVKLKLKHWIMPIMVFFCAYFVVFMMYQSGWLLSLDSVWKEATISIKLYHLDVFFRDSVYRPYALLLGTLGLALSSLIISQFDMKHLQQKVLYFIPTFILLGFVPVFIGLQPDWSFENGTALVESVYRPFSMFLFNERIEALLYYNADSTPQQILTVAIPFALFLAIGGHFPSIVRDVVSLARHVLIPVGLYIVHLSPVRSLWKMVSKPELVHEVPAADLPSPVATPQPSLASVGRMMTEQDLQQGDIDIDAQEKRYEMTEKDQYLGVDSPGDVMMTEQDAQQALYDRGAGLEQRATLESDDMPSGYDLNFSFGGDDEYDEEPPLSTSKADKGTGIHVNDIPEMGTELDARAGLEPDDMPSGYDLNFSFGDDEYDEEPPLSTSKVDKGTGIHVNDPSELPEMGTELDVRAGLEQRAAIEPDEMPSSYDLNFSFGGDDEYDEEPPLSTSKVDKGTGDVPEMGTELDARAALEQRAALEPDDMPSGYDLNFSFGDDDMETEKTATFDPVDMGTESNANTPLEEDDDEKE